MRLPMGVMMDSGWNWMPSVVCSRWRRPYLAILGSGRDHERRRSDASSTRASDSACVNGFVKPSNNLSVAVTSEFSVHEALRSRLAAERQSHRLMTEADAEQRHAAGEAPDDVARTPASSGRPVR